MKKVKLCIRVLALAFILIVYINIFVPIISYGATVTQEVKSGINNFPPEYQIALNKLKALHPNWNFESYYTGIDWNELIRNETGDVLHRRSVVPSSSNSLWKCSICADNQRWSCASSSIVKYFIDPRNFLNEINIFQFEELSYNKNVHTLDSVKKSVKGTFLENSVTYYSEKDKSNITKTYSEIILEAAELTNISPFHIKAKIIQEVGSNGSPSVSGTYPNYENLYNFFNYGAYDTGDPIANGLEFARNKGWDNPYKAIVGGAELIGSSYINVGQNTSYFFKFDVVGGTILKAGTPPATVNTTSFYSHQYMTNIMDPYSQSSSIYNMYAANGNLNSSLNFIIPVYNNMPSYNKKPSTLTENDGTLYYANVTKELLVRTNPSTRNIIATLEKDDVVVMLDRKFTTVDSYLWDKVKLANGQIGYSASMYLESCIPELERAVIDETKKEIKATPNITISQIIKELGCTNYEVLDTSGKKIDKPNVVGTGYKINILKSDNKTIDKTYTLIKVGDVNGDGNILANDALSILKYSIKAITLSGIYEKAADINGDGNILASDALTALKYSVGIATINI